MKVRNNTEFVQKKFLAYATTEIAHLKKIGRFGIANNYSCACRRFATFLQAQGMNDITFKQMTSILMSDFEHWLQSQNICRNSSSCYLRSLNAIWNKAFQYKSVIHNNNYHIQENPFLRTYRGVAKTQKRALDTNDIRRLYTLNIEDIVTKGGTKHKNKRLQQRINRLQLTRDLFLFSFYSRGMAFVDMAYLRKTNLKGDTISYLRRKTGQRIEIRIEPPIKNILDRISPLTPYLLPIITENSNPAIIYKQYQSGISLYNKALRELGRMLGGLKLTSYVSRHSWATIAHHNNAPTSAISQALGHNSERTTEIYLKSLEYTVIDRVNRLVIDSVIT